MTENQVRRIQSSFLSIQIRQITYTVSMLAFTLTALLSLTGLARAEDLLQLHCNQRAGQVVDSFTCPRTKLKLNWNFCLAKTAKNEPIFFDGCTGPSGGHAPLFYPACIQHDLCYHHEPLTTGLSQKECDEKFLEQALASCRKAQNLKSCQKWARTMFYALRAGGVVAFNCSKSKADYK